MVTNILATEVKQMLKISYLLDYKARMFRLCYFKKTRIKLLLSAAHNSRLY